MERIFLTPQKITDIDAKEIFLREGLDPGIQPVEEYTYEWDERSFREDIEKDYVSKLRANRYRSATSSQNQDYEK
jgi:hypothetical protein